MALNPTAPKRTANGHGDKAMVWRKNTSGTGQCDWGAIDPNIIRGAIDAVTKAGGAIMFGVTADGGAYSLCLLQGDEKIKDYPHSAADCEGTLRGMIEWYVDFKL